MPTPSIGPTPIERLLTLLTQALVEGQIGGVVLEHRGARTDDGFEEAWTVARKLMKSQKAYPHRTEPRHQWQKAIETQKTEWRACYLKLDSPFYQIAGVLLRELQDSSRFAGDSAVMGELVA